MPQYKFFRNNVRIADIDENSLWMTDSTKPGIYLLVDQDNLRILGYGWYHIMTPVPEDQVPEILNNLSNEKG
jgi:hypothetical protein